MKRLKSLSPEMWIAALATLGIAVHLILRWGTTVSPETQEIPLLVVLVGGGIPLVYELAKSVFKLEFGADLLAGISIVTAVLLGEYLAGAIIVLMLSGGESIEAYAIGRASSVLEILAARSPTMAMRRSEGELVEVPVEDVAVGDTVVVLPNTICPVDGEVTEGHGTMDESYLTGEPFEMSKAPGSQVISGALNGNNALVIVATQRAENSRYAQIMTVMEESSQQRPRIRRLADQLGAFYTPLAVGVALAAWLVSGDPVRFLAVLVVATPCPLLIGIPVAIVGSISLAARRGMVIKDPSVLETVETCDTLIFDKTGTLTYGRPTLTEVLPGPGFEGNEVLQLTAALEAYSKHPLAGAIVDGARERGLAIDPPEALSEEPGKGLVGTIHGRELVVTGRSKAPADWVLPEVEAGLECVIGIDGSYAATLRFRDEPRAGTRPFIQHLFEHHSFREVMLVSGDRESEVRYLAEKVGITKVLADQSPEDKVAVVREARRHGNVLFIGDGMNDAPAMMEATVGVAMGTGSDVTTESAGAILMEPSMRAVDEFLHIGKRLRRIALQSAVGGMLLSVGGMGFAAVGLLPPVAGAMVQEVIDIWAVLNALRAARAPGEALTDYRVEE